ncbi:MAG: hypothetical protein ACI4N4_02045 [Candidatus Fimenecus sp.]
MKKFISKIKENKKLKNAVISALSITLAFALFGSGFAVYRNSEQSIEVGQAENQNTLKEISEKTETNGNAETENFSDGETFSNFSENGENEQVSEADDTGEATLETSTAPNVQNTATPISGNSANGNGGQSSGKTQNNKPAPQPPKNDGTTTTKPNVPTVPPTEAPTERYATVGDEKAIADRVIYYINEFRKQEGHIPATKLPGLTQVCEYRSRQLVTNFAHDTDDIREAATVYKYGKYIDPSLYGISGDPYYEDPGNEALCKGTCHCQTIDEVAKDIAFSFRNSKGHWAYVGSVEKEYTYIAAGITIANGMIYCCVSVTDDPQYG